MSLNDAERRRTRDELAENLRRSGLSAEIVVDTGGSPAPFTGTHRREQA